MSQHNIRNAVFWAAFLAAALLALSVDGNILRSLFAPPGFELPFDLNCFRTNAALILGHPGLTAAAAAKTCDFMYPPPFLLIAAPLAWLSPSSAYALWTTAAAGLLIVAASTAKFPWPAIALGMLAPPSLYCMTIGQTGEITSALLLLSLGLAVSNPILAGCFAGCLIIKPQLALLLPVCFVASRNGRALVTAGLTAGLICALAAWAFGLDAWRHFLGVQTAMMKATLALPWPQPFQGDMVSVFMAARGLGASLPISSAIQIFITIGAAVATWRLWSPATRTDPQTRLLLMLCLVPLATPYAYIYDIPGTSLALLAVAARPHSPLRLPAAAFLLVTGGYIFISMVSFPTGGPLLLILTVLIWSQSDAPSHFSLSKNPPSRKTPPRSQAPDASRTHSTPEQ